MSEPLVSPTSSHVYSKFKTLHSAQCRQHLSSHWHLPSASTGPQELDQSLFLSCSLESVVVRSNRKNIHKFCCCCCWSCCCRVYGTVNSGWSYLSVHKSLCIHSGFQVSDSKNQYHWWSSDPPRNLCHCWHLKLEFSSAKLTCFLRSLWTLSSLPLTSSSSSFPRVANFLLSKSCSWYYYWMPSSQ